VSYEGGHSPFEADITDHVSLGQEVRITACVDNTLSFQSIRWSPAALLARLLQRPGLHRSVWLYSTALAHLTDVTVTTDLDGNTGVVGYVAEAEKAEGLQTQVVLRDAEGVEVAPGTRASASARSRWTGSDS
jgi:beta-glucuronidase